MVMEPSSGLWYRCPPYLDLLSRQVASRLLRQHPQPDNGNDGNDKIELDIHSRQEVTRDRRFHTHSPSLRHGADCPGYCQCGFDERRMCLGCNAAKVTKGKSSLRPIYAPRYAPRK